jgi:hypothetical protein
VNIGGALATARGEAGLTLDQVSERTRIRVTIIRAIERDDYSMCGGDFYARGHIRAIARVVGTDPVPLITEYDEAHAPPPRAPEPGPEPARSLMTGGSPRPPANNTSASNGFTRPGGITAAEAFSPAMPLRIQGTRRLPVRAGLLVVLVLAVIAFLAYVLASQGSPHARAGGSHSPAISASHSARPSAPPSPVPAVAAPTPLPVAAASAFGPSGPGQGDNPLGASLAIDGNAATAWHSDWYATANLNGSQGTGLLLDLGRTANVSGVQLTMAPAAGGSLQLRAGNSPSLASLPVVAQGSIPGGTFTLQTSSPVPARYVLIWFTQLPPNGAGTFQAFVSNVIVSGTT